VIENVKVDGDIGVIEDVQETENVDDAINVALLKHDLASILADKTVEYLTPQQKFCYELTIEFNNEYCYRDIELSFQINESGQFVNYQYIVVFNFELEGYLNMYNDDNDIDSKQNYSEGSNTISLEFTLDELELKACFRINEKKKLVYYTAERDDLFVLNVKRIDDKFKSPIEKPNDEKQA